MRAQGAQSERELGRQGQAPAIGPDQVEALSMTGRPSFSSFFSFEAIVRQLAKWRVRAMARRRDAAFYAAHVKGAPQPEEAVACEAARYLPPRNAWRRPRAVKRCRRSAEEVAMQSILRTVCGFRRAGRLADVPWGRELERLVAQVNARMSRDDFAFDAPKIFLKPKGDGSYRALAAYGDIEDRLILGGLSSYLRRKFDRHLSPHCHSFREDRNRSHQSAVAELIAYRRAHAGETLFVAECDVMKFFDAVDHREAMRAFDSFVAKCGGKVDAAARRLVEAYLASYSFGEVMERAGDDAGLARVGRVPRGILESLHPHEDTDRLRLGLPQGGALSPLFANILLSEADAAVVGNGLDRDLLYVRFCDDMIIVHTDRAKCEAAMRRYLEAVRRCKLPVHPAEEKGFSYGAGYYGLKTKGPFAWRAAEIGDPNAAPWVSFLGYQIRFSGETRVRKETISRHLTSLRNERVRFDRLVAKVGDAAERACLLRHYRKHLIAKGVGFLRAGAIRDDSLCWAAAFPNLQAKSAACRLQMRTIDAVRDRLLHLSCGGKGKQPRYDGRPFSYYGYLLRLARPGRHRVCSDLRAYGQV